MNIKDLKKMLELYPEDLEIWVLCEGYGHSFKAQPEDIRLETEDIENERQVILLFGKK